MFSYRSRCAVARAAKTLSIAAVLSGTTSWLAAAGFQIFEVGIRGQGVAHAGMATRADGPETVFFNPAGMAYLSGNQTSFGLTQHFVKARFMGQAEYGAFAGSLAGLGFENSVTGSDGGTLSLPAAGFYTSHSLSRDIRFGLGINTPFGLSTDYGRDWAGRYLATKSSLTTININPSFAVRLHETLAIAAGVNLVYASAQLNQALDLGLLQAPLGEAPGTLGNDGLVTVAGDNWAYGFNLGTIFEPVKGTRFGVSYRSEQELEIKGTAHFDLGRFAPELFGSALQSGPVASTVKLPQWTTFGLHHAITQDWAAMVDATWTDWSVIDELRIRFPKSPSGMDTVLPTNWDDSWRFAFGVIHKPADAWTLRAGIAHEKTPVPDRTNYTPRIPAGDGLSLAFGTSYDLSDSWTLDAAYTQILIDELPIDRTEGVHRVSGGYDGAVSIIGLQLMYTFD